MKILLIEDNPGDIRLLQEIMGEAANNFTTIVVDRLGLGLEFLLSHEVDVVLLDLSLPDSSGLETLTKLQSQFPRMPIVIMTSITDEELALQALHLGAQDYLIKGQVDRNILQRAFSYAIERKKLVEEVKGLNNELKKRALELEAANRELESFSYSLSHDLRAPLRSLNAYSQIFLNEYGDKIDGQGRDYIEKIKKSSLKMSDLINDIQKLFHIRNSKLNLTNISLSKIVLAIADKFKEYEPERKVSFKIKEEVFVNGDQSFLEIAFENILENAWKFTSKEPEGKIEFGVTEENGKIIYFIKDNGIGFDMKYADDVFKPFRRLHEDHNFPGTGIGLSIVERIISCHSGHIWAESEQGKGTTLYFTLGNK